MEQLGFLCKPKGAFHLNDRFPWLLMYGLLLRITFLFIVAHVCTLEYPKYLPGENQALWKITCLSNIEMVALLLNYGPYKTYNVRIQKC